MHKAKSQTHVLPKPAQISTEISTISGIDGQMVRC